MSDAGADPLFAMRATIWITLAVGAVSALAVFAWYAVVRLPEEPEGALRGALPAAASVLPAVLLVGGVGAGVVFAFLALPVIVLVAGLGVALGMPLLDRSMPGSSDRAWVWAYFAATVLDAGAAACVALFWRAMFV